MSRGEEGLCGVCCADDGVGVGGGGDWARAGDASRGESVVDMAVKADSRSSSPPPCDEDDDEEDDGVAAAGGCECRREDDAGEARPAAESGMNEEGEEADREVDDEDEEGAPPLDEGDVEEVLSVDMPGSLIVILRLRLLPAPDEGEDPPVGVAGDDARRLSWEGDDPPTTTEIFRDPCVGVDGAGGACCCARWPTLAPTSPSPSSSISISNLKQIKFTFEK
jgi:hypothetical protein